MKLEDVKQKIDNYFENVHAEELLDTLTKKHEMREYDFNNVSEIPDEQLVGNAKIA